MQVDVAVEREDERGLGVVAGLEEALDPPGRHGVALSLGAGGGDWGPDRHLEKENAGHVWRPSSGVSPV